MNIQGLLSSTCSRPTVDKPINLSSIKATAHSILDGETPRVRVNEAGYIHVSLEARKHPGTAALPEGEYSPEEILKICRLIAYSGIMGTPLHILQAHEEKRWKRMPLIKLESKIPSIPATCDAGEDFI